MLRPRSFLQFFGALLLLASSAPCADMLSLNITQTGDALGGMESLVFDVTSPGYVNLQVYLGGSNGFGGSQANCVPVNPAMTYECVEDVTAIAYLDGPNFSTETGIGGTANWGTYSYSDLDPIPCEPNACMAMLQPGTYTLNLSLADVFNPELNATASPFTDSLTAEVFAGTDILQPVPEPVTWCLIPGALLALVIARSRRMKRLEVR